MPRCRIWETKTLKIVMRDFAYILGRNFNSGIVFLNNGCKTPVKNGLHTEKAALSVLLVFVSSIAAKISSTFQKNFLLFIIYYFKKGSGVTSVTIVVFNTLTGQVTGQVRVPRSTHMPRSIHCGVRTHPSSA